MGAPHAGTHERPRKVKDVDGVHPARGQQSYVEEGAHGPRGEHPVQSKQIGDGRQSPEVGFSLAWKLNALSHIVQHGGP